MNILTIDTSQQWLNLAFSDEHKIINVFSELVGNRHAEKFIGSLDRLLLDSNAVTKDIGLIAVVTGPGTFTGLRVGISFAKGLAMALDIRCLPLNTLDAMAVQSGIGKGTVSPMIDARKGQVFTALYDVENGTISRSSPCIATEPARWLASLPEGTAVLGSGAVAFAGLINECDKNISALEDATPSPDPKSLYKTAMIGLNQGTAISHFDLDAFYIRPADAVAKPKQSTKR